MPTLSLYTSTKSNNCGVSRGDIHENSTTNIHHGSDIAAGCWRCLGTGHEDRSDARRSGGTAECPGGDNGAGREIRPKQSARKNRASGADSAHIRQQAAEDG